MAVEILQEGFPAIPSPDEHRYTFADAEATRTYMRDLVRALTSQFNFQKTDADTLAGALTVVDEAYGVTWNGATEAPTKNAVYDKIETFRVPGEAIVVTLTDGATPALNAALGNHFILTASGNRTIAVPTNAVSGKRIIIEHRASGADRTLALNSGAGGFRFGTDVTALTLTTSGTNDYIGCIYNSTDSYWDVVAYVKGY
jgi:hypothetical protein